jgi:hypothetical protein
MYLYDRAVEHQASSVHNDSKPQSPEINAGDLSGKTKEQIRDLADDKGLVQGGRPDKEGNDTKYKDPVTNKIRIRIDEGHIEPTTGKPYDLPSAAKPHVHGFDKDGKPIRDESGDKHFPLNEGPPPPPSTEAPSGSGGPGSGGTTGSGGTGGNGEAGCIPPNRIPPRTPIDEAIDEAVQVILPIGGN